MKLVSVPEMLAIERAADAAGHSYAAMMEHAGRGLAEIVGHRESSQAEKSALGLVGTGNNGGDTLVALTQLRTEFGWQTTAYLVKARPEGDPLVERLLEAGGEVVGPPLGGSLAHLERLIRDHGVLLDGILGTGTKLPLREVVTQVLAACQEILAALDPRPFIVAVDCPSGVDCETGDAADTALRADLTVTMAAVKRGMLQMPAMGLIGELQLAGIGLPDGLGPWESVRREVVDRERVRELLPHRPLDSHKGTFGTVLIVGGSISYTGAPMLAGKAAYRAGAGLVTLAIPEPLYSPLAGQFPEATWLVLPHEGGVISPSGASSIVENLGRISAMAVGPGLGLEDPTLEFLQRLLRGGVEEPPAVVSEGRGDEEGERPAGTGGWGRTRLVVDADGLKLLARIRDWPAWLPPRTVLTPHPGEMAVLTGLEKDRVQADRLGVAEEYAVRWGHVVVLKGAGTVIASPSGPTGVIPIATPALARAGTGDVLTGLIAGLLSQGVSPYEAAISGAWIHAQAGVLAGEVLGTDASVVAGDVVDLIPDVLARF